MSDDGLIIDVIIEECDDIITTAFPIPIGIFGPPVSSKPDAACTTPGTYGLYMSSFSTENATSCVSVSKGTNLNLMIGIAPSMTANVTFGIAVTSVNGNKLNLPATFPTSCYAAFTPTAADTYTITVTYPTTGTVQYQGQITFTAQ